MAVNRSLLESLGMTAACGALACGALALRSARGSGAVLAALAWLAMVFVAGLTLRSVIEGNRRGEHGAFALLSVQAAALVWLLFRLIE